MSALFEKIREKIRSSEWEPGAALSLALVVLAAGIGFSGTVSAAPARKPSVRVGKGIILSSTDSYELDPELREKLTDIFGSFMSQFSQEDIDELRSELEEIDKAVREAAPEIEKAVKEVAPEIEKAVKEAAPEIEKAVKEVAPEIEKAVKEAAPEIEKAVKEAAPEIEKAVEEAASEVEKAVEEAAPEIEKAVKEVAPEIEKSAEEAGPEVEDAIAPAKDVSARDRELDRLLDSLTGTGDRESATDSETGATAPEAADNTADSEDSMKEFEFTQWSGDSSSLKAIRDYVEAVTDEGSDSFIPAEDRIAVFDYDGTLHGELCPTYIEYMLFVERVANDPDYEATDEMKEIAAEVLRLAKTGKGADDLDIRIKRSMAKAFEGESLEFFEDYVRRFMEKPVIGFKGLTWNDMYFKPMLEVVDYLNANDFKCYIASASNRYEVRVLADGMLNIAPENIIGTDFGFVASGAGDTPSDSYQYDAGDELVIDGELGPNNLYSNKVYSIRREIGRQPVLAFGNSPTDYGMATYVTSGNKYKSAAFFVLADDGERDFADTEKAAKRKSEIEGRGWIAISQRSEWKTIY